jgi:hypothetical protein
MTLNNTFTLIEKVTLSAPQSSVTFMSVGNIPSTYTDLYVRASVRSSTTSGNSNLFVYFNGTTGTSYNMMQGLSDGNGTQVRAAQTAYPWIEASPSITNNNGNFTANTFTNLEVWIQNYRQTALAQTAINTILASESNVATAYTGITNDGFVNAGSPINSVTIDGTDNFIAGSTFYLYGVANLTKSGSPDATGGDVIATDGTYWYHAFTASGTFTPTKALSCDVLTIAGGGGGFGGGGGAGGFRVLTSQSLSTNNYTVTIGAGGAGGGNNGSNTTVSGTGLTTISATGGGAGGYQGNGQPGGSGGGAGGGLNLARTGGAGNSGGYSPSEGNAGGNAASMSISVGGGGGGAGAVGANSTSTVPAAGGNGTSAYSSWGAATSTGQNISGTFWYAGGGSGADQNGNSAPGGNGGGGQGDRNPNTGIRNDGLPNMGAGGGGGYFAIYGNGGSGLVIVRYAV